MAHRWAEVLHHPCVLAGPYTRGQSQRWPRSERKCYIILAFSGVPKQSDKVRGGAEVGRSATTPLRPRGSPNNETKAKLAQKWAEVLHHPCILGGPQTRGQRQRWPICVRKCYITPEFSGVAKQGDKVKGGPYVRATALSLLRSRGSPNKGTKSNTAHMWAEVLNHPCVFGCCQTRGQRQRQHKCERKCYITPAFSGVGKQGGKVKGGPEVGSTAISLLCSRGSPNKGTKSKVAHMWAQVLHHPCILGGRQTRGQSKRRPKRGRKCYITPAFSRVPKQGDKVKSGPQVGGSGTAPLHSQGSPKQGDKFNVKGGPQVGGSATSPVRSRGSPNKRAKANVPHKRAKGLHHH